MDLRKVFDSNVSPEDFDKWRTRYCEECFADVVEHAKLGPGKTALEIGPGTGQATEPIMKTGCSYLAIELGENFAEAMKDRFSAYDNFRIVNADFETYDFGSNRFDLVYSAATIQWIPEKIAFSKTYDILKSGGTFAMMLTKTDYKSANEALYSKIQEVYDQYFHPEYQYSRRMEYGNVINYGFIDYECRQYHQVREYNADAFVSWTRIMCPQLTIPEPDKTNFLEGIRDSVLSFGDKITLNDTVVLHLARKR